MWTLREVRYIKRVDFWNSENMMKTNNHFDTVDKKIFD